MTPDSQQPTGTHPVLRIVKLVLSVLYLGTLTYIVFLARRRRNFERRYLNLVPVEHTMRDFHRMGPLTGGRYNFFTNLMGNVLLFIPLAFVLMNYGKTERLKPVILTGFIVSCCIETLQYVLEIGFADVDDVILNTLGTAIGAALFLFFRRKGLIQFDH